MTTGYTTNQSAGEGWEPFVLPDGSTIGEAHLLRGDDTDGGAYYTGFWRVTGADPPAPFRYEITQNETIYIVEGGLTIEIDGGPRLELGPGDMASFTPGTRSTWHLTKTPFKEAFVLS